MKKHIVGIAFVAVAALAAQPAHAAVNVAVAVPGSSIAGYGTPRVVVTQALPATFVHLDPTGNHDIVSVQKRQVGTTQKRLFESDVISAGETATIEFLPNVAPGDYAFICTIHPITMTGTLTLLD